MRKVELEVTYRVSIEINDDNEIVQEYESDNELFQDIASYRFERTLPVIGQNGVYIRDIEVLEIEI